MAMQQSEMEPASDFSSVESAIAQDFPDQPLQSARQLLEPDVPVILILFDFKIVNIKLNWWRFNWIIDKLRVQFKSLPRNILILYVLF